MTYPFCDRALRAGERNWCRAKLQVFIVGILMACCFARAADQAVDSNADPMMISLTVNGQTSPGAVLALKDSEGQWWLPVTALQRVHVATSDLTVRTFNETDFVAARSLPVEDIRFDEPTQSLQISLSPSGFEATRLRSRPLTHGQPARVGGAFMNYDLLAEHTSAGDSYTAYTELGAGLGPGVAITEQLYIDRPGHRSGLRLNSSFTVDDIDHVRTLRIGDSMTRTPTLIGRPVRFGGLQWGTNFQTRPDLITVPVATLSGQSALPSTADLYVNNVLQSRHPLPPGPFSITSAPIVTGNGEVLLKVTDLAGQEQLISQRIYSTTSLLAPGLSDYSFELGALRNNFGRISNDYGDMLASAGWRHGLNDRLTTEAGASVQRGGPENLLAGIALALPDIGIATAAVGLSHGDAGSGSQVAIGFEQRGSRHSFSVRTQSASADYREAGVDASLTLRRLDSVFYGYQFAGVGSLGLSWMRQQRATNEAISIASASFSTIQTPWGSAVLSLSHVGGSSGGTSVNLFWVMSLGTSTNVSAYHTQGVSGSSQQVFQLQKNLRTSEDWGYRLQVANHAAQQAAVYAQNAYGLARLEAAELNGQTSARVGFAGAVATLDGRWFLSRRIDGSFGVAHVPGFANVRVLVDNQLAARTDADGYALLPRLYPYVKNNVSVEQLDLPLDVQIGSLRMHPVPAWRSGVLIDVPVRHVRAATLNLIQDDGTPVPAGADVRLVDAEEDATEQPGVGREGLVYLSGMRQDNLVKAHWPGAECQAKIPYRPEPGSIPHLGQFTCHRTETAR